jgi:hypothetical protein
MNLFFRIIFLLLAAIAIAGCASPAGKQAMTISPSDIISNRSEKLTNAVYVSSVSGGKSTNPLWTSQVDNETFKSALEQSLAISGYKASDPSKAKYLVHAELKKLEQPLIGIDFDVVSEVSYTVEVGDEKNTYPISANGTATFSESVIGFERLRIANEKSIKANIIKFINFLNSKFP